MSQSKICPKCQTVAPLTAGLCRGCDHQFRTQFTPPPVERTQLDQMRLQQTQADLPVTRPGDLFPSRPQPLMPQDYLSCRVCGNSAVERVATLCQAGSWTSRSSSASVGAAYARGVGIIPTVSGSASVTAGASSLAQMLMPPPQPTFRAPSAAQTLFGAALACLASVLLLSGGGALFTSPTEGGSVPGGLVSLVIGGGIAVLSILLLRGVSQDASRSRQQAEAAMPRWEQSMNAWNRLFYCSRCGHAFDPETGQYQLPENIAQLV